MCSFERPIILITPNSNDFDSTESISKLYIKSTEMLNNKSITRLKINCKNVTDKCANLKSYKIKASTEIGKNPSAFSAKAICY